MDELYSLLVPLYKDRLIVPRSCVPEVIRYAPLEQADETGWLRGYTVWSEHKVPVISFERLCGLQVAETGGRTRIAIFHSISRAYQGGYYGILTEGFPQLVRINRDVMKREDQQTWPEGGPVICQIRMINEYPLIPDLERVESLISELMAETASV